MDTKNKDTDITRLISADTLT